jgi:hypothetical protein
LKDHTMPTLDIVNWLLIAIIVVLAVANALLLRRQRKQDAPLMRTANSSLVNRQAAQALHAANQQASARPRVRAIGESNQVPPARLPPSPAPLRPSFDSRRQTSGTQPAVTGTTQPQRKAQ